MDQKAQPLVPEHRPTPNVAPTEAPGRAAGAALRFLPTRLLRRIGLHGLPVAAMVVLATALPRPLLADYEEITFPEAALATIDLRALPEEVDLPEDPQRLLIAGRDAVLGRHYADAEWFFSRAARDHPDSPVGPLGRMLIYQAQMLENYDMAWDSEYQAARTAAKKRLETALDQPGNEAWDHLLGGAFHGMAGLHAMRKNQYLASVRFGLGAVRHLRRSRRTGRLLRDVDLGLGGYDYFRSVVSRQAPWVPFVPDRREQGLALIERARAEGEFMQPIAELALVFTLIDENRTDESITLARSFLERYPNNVVARIQLGRALSRRRAYKEAIAEFDRVLEIHPLNRIVGYYLGHTLVQSAHDLEVAECVVRTFLERSPDEHSRGWGLELLGDIARRNGDTETAITLWRRAHRVDSRDTSAKRKIRQAREQKRAERTRTMKAHPGPG